MTAARRDAELEALVRQRAALVAEVKALQQELAQLPKNLGEFKKAIFDEAKVDAAQFKKFDVVKHYPNLSGILNEVNHHSGILGNELRIICDAMQSKTELEDIAREDNERNKLAEEHKQQQEKLNLLKSGLSALLIEIAASYYNEHVFPNYSKMAKEKARKPFYENFLEIGASIEFSTSENADNHAEVLKFNDLTIQTRKKLFEILSRFLCSADQTICLLAAKKIRDLLECEVENKSNDKERYKKYIHISAVAHENKGWGILAPTTTYDQYKVGLTKSGVELVRNCKVLSQKIKTLENARTSNIQSLRERIIRQEKTLKEIRQRLDGWKVKIKLDHDDMVIRVGYLKDIHGMKVVLAKMDRNYVNLKNPNAGALKKMKEKLKEFDERCISCETFFGENEKIFTIKGKIEEWKIQIKQNLKAIEATKKVQQEDKQSTVIGIAGGGAAQSQPGELKVAVVNALQDPSKTREDVCLKINKFIYFIIMNNLAFWNARVSMLGKMHAYFDGARLTDKKTGKTYSVPRGIYNAIQCLTVKKQDTESKMLLAVLQAFDERLDRGSRYCTRARPTNLLYNKLIDCFAVKKDKQKLRLLDFPKGVDPIAALNNIFETNESLKTVERPANDDVLLVLQQVAGS